MRAGRPSQVLIGGGNEQSEMVSADRFLLRRPVLYPTELRAHMGGSVSVAEAYRHCPLRRCTEAVALWALRVQRAYKGFHRTASWTKSPPRVTFR